MSKKKEPGYKQKYTWLQERFAEGLKIKILHEKGGRDTAFIEYVPGEYAWRAVNADGYMVIHCLWVVGKGKGKGYGRRLIEECIKDARTQGMQGVAMITSDRVWLADLHYRRKLVNAHNSLLVQRGWGYIVVGAPLLLLALSWLMGRSFCGWVCPMGTTLDLARNLAKTIPIHHREHRGHRVNTEGLKTEFSKRIYGREGNKPPENQEDDCKPEEHKKRSYKCAHSPWQDCNDRQLTCGCRINGIEECGRPGRRNDYLAAL
jgi:GNAT superfamily N-acetyltransferase